MYRVPAEACRRLRGIAVGLVAGTALLTCTINPADARSRDAAFIIDVNNGRALYESNADAIRHPASLTKVMTLYLLFEKLEAGQITLNSRIPISANAAAEVPTKLGLKAGSTISVEDAIKALVVRSANDVATAIGEFIGGNEANFARLMTGKARQLGMPRTVYRNAHGLPNSAQVTTAREQAILGIAIQQRFPKYFRFFATRSFKFRGRTLRGHNRLLGSVPGVNGIKTGYIRASGFNLITSLTRGDRKIVGVVLGGRTAAARDARMRSLISDHIMVASVKRTAPPVIAAARAAVPVPAPVSRPAIAVAVLPPTPARPAALPIAKPEFAKSEMAKSEMAKPIEVASVAPVTALALAAEAETQVQAIAQPSPVPRDTPDSAPVATSDNETRLASASGTPVRFNDNGALQAPRLGSTDPIKPIIVRAITIGPSGIGRAHHDPAPQSREARLHTVSSVQAAMPQRSEPAAAASPARSEAAEVPPAQAAAANTAVTASPEPGESEAAPVAAETEQTDLPRSGWVIQVGAFVTENDARVRLDAARSKATAKLKKADPYTERTDRGSRTYFRARFAGFDERSDAEEACRELKRNEIQCLALRI